jgi:hypothetical protein
MIREYRGTSAPLEPRTQVLGVKVRAACMVGHKRGGSNLFVGRVQEHEVLWAKVCIIKQLACIFALECDLVARQELVRLHERRRRGEHDLFVVAEWDVEGAARIFPIEAAEAVMV